MYQLLADIFKNASPEAAEAEAFISLAMLVINVDKRVSSAETKLLDSIIGSDVFGNEVNLGKMIGKIRSSSIEALRSVEGTDAYIKDCAARIKDFDLKKELNGKLLELTQSDKTFSKIERELLTKINQALV